MLQGIHLEEPSSPVAKQQQQQQPEEIVSMRHGVTITKIPKHNVSPVNSNSMVQSPRRYRMSQQTPGSDTGPGKVASSPTISPTKSEVNSIISKTNSMSLCKNSKDDSSGNTCDSQCSPTKHERLSISTDKVPKVILNLDEDEGLDVRESTSDYKKEDNSCEKENNSYKTSVKQSSEESSADSSGSEVTESDATDATEEQTGQDSVDCNLSNDKPSTGSPKKSSRHKEHRRRKFRDLLPQLRRSQSVGCESDLVPDHALFLAACPGIQDSKVGSSFT